MLCKKPSGGQHLSLVTWQISNLLGFSDHIDTYLGLIQSLHCKFLVVGGIFWSHALHTASFQPGNSATVQGVVSLPFEASNVWAEIGSQIWNSIFLTCWEDISCERETCFALQISRTGAPQISFFFFQTEFPFFFMHSVQTSSNKTSQTIKCWTLGDYKQNEGFAWSIFVFFFPPPTPQMYTERKKKPWK